jgi:hypothetical protein
LTGQHLGKSAIEDRGWSNRGFIEVFVEVAAQIQIAILAVLIRTWRNRTTCF